MALRDVLDDGQAQPRAAGFARAAAVDPVKAFGEAGDMLRFDADAAVLYAEHPFAFPFFPLQLDFTAFRGVADGIADQVAESTVQFAFIAQHLGGRPADVACDVLEVSRSGYYAWRDRPQSRQSQRRATLTAKIRTVHADNRGVYGSPRVFKALQAGGESVCQNTVAKVMRSAGLRAKTKRKFVPCTTDSAHAQPIAPNVLDRQFNPMQPDQAWVADITYIRTRSGWLYLAVVLDLFSRKVVGWAMAPDMQAQLVCRALQLAIMQRQPAPGLIVHSDRGSQYAGAAHQALLTRHGLVGSMSRKGNCWDNAVMERFFLSLKMERVWQRDYANHAEAMIDVADYIVGFYNSVRLHSTLGNLPPNAFEQQSAIKQPIHVCEKLDQDM